MSRRLGDSPLERLQGYRQVRCIASNRGLRPIAYDPQLRRAPVTELSRGYDWIRLAPSSLLKSCPAQTGQAGTFGSAVRLAVMLEPQCRDNFVIGADHDWHQAWGSCRSSAAVVPQGGRKTGRLCGRFIGYELPMTRRDNFVLGARYILVHRLAHEGQAN